MEQTLIPTVIKLHQHSKLLELSFEDGQQFNLPYEYLRVYSPSAEVQGHGAGEGILQIGKERVSITTIEPVGHYAVKIVFDDGHNTGLYTWNYLYQLGCHYTEYWQRYLTRLNAAGIQRIL